MSDDTPSEVPKETGSADIDFGNDEDVEKQILEKLPQIFKMDEKAWREAIIRDYNSLARIVILSQKVMEVGNRNFGFISEWMKKTDVRLAALEEKLAFLETIAKNDDPKKKKDFYLQ